MKKRLLVMVLAIVCIVTVTVGVFAEVNRAENLIIEPIEIVSDIDEITNALNTSNVIKGLFEPIYNVENINNEIVLADAAYSVTQADATENLSGEEGVRVYSVSIDDEVSSIYSEISDENDIWIVPNEIDGVVSFVYLKKGEDIAKALDKINALDVSEIYKDRMRRKAAANAGKWYVSYVEEQRVAQDAKLFIEGSNVESLINNNNVNSVVDIKYVYITNNNMLAAVVKTDNGEYVTPYVTVSENSAVNNILYSVDEYKNVILN